MDALSCTSSNTNVVVLMYAYHVYDVDGDSYGYVYLGIMGVGDATVTATSKNGATCSWTVHIVSNTIQEMYSYDKPELIYSSENIPAAIPEEEQGYSVIQKYKEPYTSPLLKLDFCTKMRFFGRAIGSQNVYRLVSAREDGSFPLGDTLTCMSSNEKVVQPYLLYYTSKKYHNENEGGGNLYLDFGEETGEAVITLSAQSGATFSWKINVEAEEYGDSRFRKSIMIEKKKCIRYNGKRLEERRDRIMPDLSDRVGSFTDSVIRRMTRINDAQEDSINLSQGFPDFDPPMGILDTLEKVVKKGPHQYSITFGARNFRDAVARKHGKAIGREIDPEQEVVVTCGGTEAMMAAMMTICNPGDKVIVFSPFYENYGADAILSGADPIYVPLVPPDFQFDQEQLEDAFRQGVKAIIVCNPSNPCGKVFTREELTYIGELAEKYDAFVVTDEVYEHIVYDPYVHVHMAGLPGMYERTITCNSLSKTYSITGWRLGYLVGPANVIEAAKKVHDFLTVGAAAPLQEAATVGLNFGEEYYQQLKELYTEKRDYFIDGLDAIGLKHTVPQGSYFVLIDISDFLALPQFAGWTDLKFCEWMVQQYGVAAVPGSSFFREPVNHLIRVHFARSQETLQEALRRLGRMAELLKVQE